MQSVEYLKQRAEEQEAKIDRIRQQIAELEKQWRMELEKAAELWREYEKAAGIK